MSRKVHVWFGGQFGELSLPTNNRYNKFIYKYIIRIKEA